MYVKKRLGILSLLMVFSMLSSTPAFAVETMTAEEVAQENRELWLDEDFSTDDGVWSISGSGVSIDTQNGVLSFDKTTTDYSMAMYDFKNIGFTDDFGVTYKMKLDTKEDMVARGMFSYGGVEIQWLVYPTKSQMGMSGLSTAGYAPAIGKWVEFYNRWEPGKGKDGNPKLTIYYRYLESEDKSWREMKSGTPSLTSPYDRLYFNTYTPGVWQIDDVRIFQDHYIKLEEPQVSAGNVVTAGTFAYDLPGFEKNRSAAVIAATYDKEHGYTTGVQSAFYPVITHGTVLNLANTFSFPDFDAENEMVATMFWDSLDTGIPLAPATGTVMVDQTDVKPTEGQEAGLTATVNYNEVEVAGYTGKANSWVTATILKEGVVCAITQAKSNSRGMISTKLGIDPDECASGDYTLRMQYADKVATETLVPLSCNDAIPASGIASEDDLQTFIENHGSPELKELLAVDGLLPYVFKHYQKDAEAAEDIYALRADMESASLKGKDELSLVTEVNSAAAADKWAEVETLITHTYRTFLGLPENPTSGVVSTKDLFLRMEGGYLSAEDVLAAYETAKDQQIAAESNSGGIVGGGIVGGGSVGGGSVGGGIVGGGSVGGGSVGGGSVGGGYRGGGTVAVEDNYVPEEVTKPVEKPEPKVEFSDLESVPWAEKSIKALQELGVIAGEGDGTFAPNRPVSREEFLKLAMVAAEIPLDAESTVTFGDVDAETWYRPFVAAAFEKGIVNGISETEFGIGQQITRADMTVILERILKASNFELKPLSTASVFDDWMQIPIYARDSVAALCSAKLIQGVGNNCFAPMDSATRAEAAVAIYRIYQSMNEGR